MNLLPLGPQPKVYYFRLFLDELYHIYPTKKVCLITDANVSDFTANSIWVPYATGSIEAVSYNKDVQTRPTYYSAIPKSVISDEIINSRQLTGTTFTLDIQGVSPVRQVYPLMSGVIGAITSDDFSVKLELVSESEKLKTQGVLKVSQDCMNTLGVGKCTVPNPSINLPVASIVGNVVNLNSPVSAFDPLSEYELTVGTTSYLVDKSQSTTTSLYIIGKIMGKPQFVKYKKHCNQSLLQCGKYNNLKQFNGSPFLTASVLNVIL